MEVADVAPSEDASSNNNNDDGGGDDDDHDIERRNSRFCTIFSQCLQHVRSSGQCAIECESRANTSDAYHVQNVVCYAIQRSSSAINSDRVEVAFNSAQFRWLKRFTSKGGEETGVTGEMPRRRASENYTY